MPKPLLEYKKEMTYLQDLLNPKWQKKRLRIFERDKWTCQICSNKKKTLAIHHKKYIKGKKPWEYPSKLLTTVCQPCHDFIYNEETIRKRLAYLESKITKKFNKKLSREIDRILSLSE